MSRRIIRHQEARQDLLDEAYYIAEDSLDSSDQFLAATEKAFNQLAEMPGMGTTRDFNHPDLAGLRMWPVPGFRKYLIFYRATEQYVEIIRVLHSARDIARIFEPEDAAE